MKQMYCSGTGWFMPAYIDNKWGNITSIENTTKLSDTKRKSGNTKRIFIHVWTKDTLKSDNKKQTKNKERRKRVSEKESDIRRASSLAVPPPQSSIDIYIYFVSNEWFADDSVSFFILFLIHGCVRARNVCACYMYKWERVCIRACVKWRKHTMSCHGLRLFRFQAPNSPTIFLCPASFFITATSTRKLSKGSS